jgi:hypothetical protein
MEEFSPQQSKKRFYIMMFLLFIIEFFLLILIILNLSTNAESKEIITAQVTEPTCPQDYCLDWIYGSCAGKGERYKERTCFDYPENINCEQEKRTYYDKSSEPDPFCP